METTCHSRPKKIRSVAVLIGMWKSISAYSNVTPGFNGAEKETFYQLNIQQP